MLSIDPYYHLQPQTPTKLVDDLAEIIKKENDDLTYSELSVSNKIRNL